MRFAPGSPFANPRGMRASALLYLCLFSALTTAGCSSPEAATSKPADAPEPVQDGVVHIHEASRPFVATEIVSGARTVTSITAAARVEFRDGAVSQLGAPLDGRVLKVHVQVGDRVREGDPLVTLDCPDAAEMR